jgi:tetratricopeptide (TPR) repeat protein
MFRKAFLFGTVWILIIILVTLFAQSFLSRLVRAQPQATATAIVSSLLTNLRPAATVTPTAIATRGSTISLPPTAVPPTTTPAPIYAQAGESATMSGFSYIRQTWNNCGPATLAMNLSYWGSTLDQATIGSVLRPFQDDKNVSPVELAEYAQSQGYRALVRVNGDGDRLRTLLANGIPVIIETWLESPPGDGLGHYRMLVGYDDAAANWIGYDSYYRENLVNPTGDYQGIRMDYTETDVLWHVFNRTYVVIYSEDKADLVAAILGADIDDGAMWARSLQAAEAVLAQDNDDAFAWFNQGTSLTALGRYDEAAAAFDQARSLGLPPRMLWYQFAPFQAYYESGRYEDVISLADSVLNSAVQIEELYYWKAEAALALGDQRAADQANQRLAQLRPNYRIHYGRMAAVQAPSIVETGEAAAVSVTSSVTSSVSEPVTTTRARIASPTPTAAPRVRVEFVADVTIPDGTVVDAGESFTKIWRVRNDSAVTWEGYRLREMAGGAWINDNFATSVDQPVPDTAPGDTVDIELVITAPAQTGSYTGYWQIVNADGVPVTGGQLWTIIAVQGAGE